MIGSNFASAVSRASQFYLVIVNKMGKGGDKAATTGAKKEVLINGRFYDVSNLKHPGGSVINFYTNNEIDATQAFNNFHLRSKKANKMVELLPSRAGDAAVLAKNLLPGQDKLLEDFNKFSKELEAEGLFKPSIPHVIYRLTELIVLHAIGFWLLRSNHLLIGLLFLGIATGRCGWLMHEGGHYSLTGNIAIDKFVQVVVYGVGCGMSAGWWRSNHNKHHSMPQKLGHDVDLETLPLVAFTSKVAKKVGFTQKLWIKWQPVLFPVITTVMVALGWQLYLHPRYIMRTKNYQEAASFVVRYVLWTLLVTAKFGVAKSALLYLAYNWIGSNYIFINFAVSHTHLDVVPKEDTQVDWVRYAAIYTINVAPGPFKWVNWWMCFLNFQIEHHLFPSMPQFRHPTISKRVKALFEKHGLKYDQRSYTEAMKCTFKNLHKVGVEVFLG